jgi:iron transport multicopper oxidase
LCYKIGLDLNGIPQFTLVGQSAASSAGRVGIGKYIMERLKACFANDSGVPTVTSNKGQPGTGILWISDPAAGLLAFNAVPANGVLTPIAIPP